MTIKQLLEMTIGQKTGGFLLTIKMAKKFWEVTHLGEKAEGRIFHQNAIVTDETGEEMIATVKISSPEHGNHDTLKVGQIIRIIVCEIQNAYDQKGDEPIPNKKLFIEQYNDFIEIERGQEMAWGPEGAEALAWSQARRIEVKGKCRHGVVCAILSTGKDPDKEYVNKLVEFIVTGE